MVYKSKKILVVEDEKPLRQALCDKFSREGFVVSEAKNGADGLWLALHQHPDIILLDIVMPVMDGITMLYKLREDQKAKNIPVIILTNLNDPNAIAKGVEERADEYLVKSGWKIEDVVARVKERLSE